MRLNEAARRLTGAKKKKRHGDMQIKPDIGSLPCLSAHFRVTIRVLLITHKAPGNLTSLTFPGAQLQTPLHRKSRPRSLQNQTADRAVNISSMFCQQCITYQGLPRSHPGQNFYWLVFLINTAQLWLCSYRMYSCICMYCMLVHTYCISYFCITSRYPCGLISQK